MGDRNTAGGASAVARRRLGLALRALREGTHKTGEEVAHAMDRTASWISRLESGRVGIRLPDLRALLDAYELTDEARRRELEGLAAETVRRGRGWWSQYAQWISETFAAYLRLEDQAQTIMLYEDRVIPGLLQTADYGRTILANSLPSVPTATAEAWLRVRLERQQMFTREHPPAVRAILNEGALRRTLGRPDTHRAQLGQLLDKMTLNRLPAAR